VITESASLAIHNRNYIVNNVPADLFIETNGPMISTVLNKLFNTVVRNAQKQRYPCFRPKVYGMTILVQLKSKGRYQPPAYLKRSVMPA